ncbi:MAG: histidine phosphatase family protein [Candidatus Nanopelagicales bacterium]
MAAARGRIVVLRHAETEWSRDGRHTGRTDIPLTAAGEDAARSVGARLAAYRPGLVLVSPLQRARRTAELAGHPGEVAPDLLEWDYGDYEGRTTQGIQDDLGDPAWSVWTTLDGLGETVDDVAARAARVLTRCRPVVERGDDVLLVAHAHLLRILTATHLGLPPVGGRSFVLPPAAIGVLGWERSTTALLGWAV